jgi:CDP-glycerol glycerophosphotransferase (TagB/SpsB family)
LGTQSEKILTTGVPNFDNIIEMEKLHFEYKDYVLVATSDIRDLGGNEDRVHFIQECVKIADGRQLIFKLHPNENFEKSSREIRENTPADTMIFNTGSIDPMIAHCHTLITQYSSTVYLGMILGKKIYSYFPIEELKANVPIQNGGKSAEIISEIIRDFMEYEGNKKDFLAQYEPAKRYL